MHVEKRIIQLLAGKNSLRVFLACWHPRRLSHKIHLPGTAPKKVVNSGHCSPSIFMQLSTLFPDDRFYATEFWNFQTLQVHGEKWEREGREWTVRRHNEASLSPRPWLQTDLACGNSHLASHLEAINASTTNLDKDTRFCTTVCWLRLYIYSRMTA